MNSSTPRDDRSQDRFPRCRVSNVLELEGLRGLGWIRPRDRELVRPPPCIAAGRPGRDRIGRSVIYADLASLGRDPLPATSLAEAVKAWGPSGRSPMGMRMRLLNRRAWLRLATIARIVSDFRFAPDAHARRCGSQRYPLRPTRSGSAPRPLTHSPARQRPVQRDRRRDRVVDCDFHYVSVDRCPGLALGGAADHQLVDPGGALWCGEWHWPSAGVEAGRVAVLADRQPEHRGSAG